MECGQWVSGDLRCSQSVSQSVGAGKKQNDGMYSQMQVDWSGNGRVSGMDRRWAWAPNQVHAPLSESTLLGFMTESGLTGENLELWVVEALVLWFMSVTSLLCGSAKKE